MNKTCFIDLPLRNTNSHKGDFGKIHILGGSKGMCGAVCLSSLAALRTGSGLVTAIIPDIINDIFQVKVTEAISYPVKSHSGVISLIDSKNIITKIMDSDAVAFGMGIGRTKDVFALLSEILDYYKGKLIIDADALFYLNKLEDKLYKSDADIVITPHVAEFSRIINADVKYIDLNREKLAYNYAKENNITVLLKGKNTVVTDGKNSYINNTGNSGMATAGSGDVLSGMIVSLMGQGKTAFESACTASYLHGLAGDLAAEELTEYSLIASDIISFIPKAIKKIIEE